MEIIFNTKKNIELVDITPQIRARMQNLVSEGICIVYCPHTTAGLIINEYEPLLEKDFVSCFAKLLPECRFQHDKVDKNARAHLLSCLVARPTVAIPVINGQLALGQWQHVIFCEFDGPRERKVIVQVR